MSEIVFVSDGIDPRDIVPIDMNNPATPQSVKELNPLLYKEAEDAYCCIYGQDIHSGIFGCGKTPQEALENWDCNYHKQIDQPSNLRDGQDCEQE